MSLEEELVQLDQLAERLSAARQESTLRACSAEGLTPTQYCAISLIEGLGTPRMSVLAEQLELTAGAVTTLVERLIRLGVVERLTSPDDRRSVSVRVTPEGSAAVARVTANHRKQVWSTFGTLSPEQRQHLLSGMSALMDAWDTARMKEEA
ncbi:putative HTH-type transcriptional regulator YusO [compost metagenome]